MATVGIAGLGLIGASLARRLQADERLAVRCFDSDRDTIVAAAEVGLHPVDSLRELLAGPLDVLFVATPVPAFGEVFGEIARLAAGRDLVVVDTGSVKGPILQLARRSFTNAGPRYLGGHPMAGTEASGFAASTPALFDGSVWVLCVEADSDRRDFVSVAQLLTSSGIGVVPLTADRHDEAVARTSHLPHVIAAALSILVGEHPHGGLLYRLAAGSFRSATRVAGTRPELAGEMCIANTGAVVEAVEQFVELCRRFQTALRGQDAIEVTQLFEVAHRYHRPIEGWISQEVTFGLGAGPFDPTERVELLAVGLAGGAVSQLRVDTASRRCTVTYTVPAELGDHPFG